MANHASPDVPAGWVSCGEVFTLAGERLALLSSGERLQVTRVEPDRHVALLTSELLGSPEGGSLSERREWADRKFGALASRAEVTSGVEMRRPDAGGSA